ncbi:A-kinase anchor protein 17A [Parasteatoda tepidariorum]|uniref:A-kinase anchor protein 17A n=1 Tax=Parasteatoda tepidariorum TaxID=114398 RepID=UPI001C72333E|nr:A-kinase anchor protein 17A [Parasteatoda tepidariorum]
MSLQTCNDITEAVALESSLGLYLKPISKIKINVQLPKLKIPGQSISSWNVMEKLKAAIRPDQFMSLKSLKITANVIKLEGELENKTTCERALARLRTTSSLKLTGFTEKLQLRAAHAPCSGPTRHEWEAFYRDAKGVNEMKPGERPDTIHLQDMPVRWFASSSKSVRPSEKILRKAFGGFGRIRRLEIPTPDNISNETTFAKKSSLHSELLFEVYIQYEEYVEFSIAIDSLRGKKLIYKDTEGKVYSADIKVDFDRTNYLSERCIKQRAALSKSNSDACTENAKQKCDTLVSNPVPGTSIADVIKDEKISPALYENEAKSLLKELLFRAEKTEKLKEKELPLKSSAAHPSQENAKRKKKIENEDMCKKEKDLHLKKKIKKPSISDSHLEKKKKNMLLEQERLLKEKLIRNLRLRELQKINESREKLRKKLAGRKALKSVLAVKKS